MAYPNYAQTLNACCPSPWFAGEGRGLLPETEKSAEINEVLLHLPHVPLPCKEMILRELRDVERF
jgi:hypothetical protein